MTALAASPMRVLLALVALAAIAWGVRQIRLREAPARAMRTLHLGRPVTAPAEKLALARQQGWVAVIFGLALLIGPFLGSERGTRPAAPAEHGE